MRRQEAGREALWESNSKDMGIANSIVPGKVVHAVFETPELVVIGMPIDANFCVDRGSPCTIWYDV